MSTGSIYPNQLDKSQNDSEANAKRSLLVGYDYDEDEYKVIGADPLGNLSVREECGVTIEQRLANIERTMRLLLLHAQIVTGEEFVEEDLEIEGE